MDELARGSNPLNAASTPEICDGIDNDLDGARDEGFARQRRRRWGDACDADDNDGPLGDLDGDGQANGVDPNDTDGPLGDLDADGVLSGVDNCATAERL